MPALAAQLLPRPLPGVFPCPLSPCHPKCLTALFPGLLPDPQPSIQPQGLRKMPSPRLQISLSIWLEIPLPGNSSQTPPMPWRQVPAHSPAPSASYIGLGAHPGASRPIAPYVTHFPKETPFFQPPTSPLPQNQCFPCSFPCRARDRLRPRQPPIPCTSSPPAASAPAPGQLLLPVSPRPVRPLLPLSHPRPPRSWWAGSHVVPTVLRPLYPFSATTPQPRPYRSIHRHRPSAFHLSSLHDGSGRSVHFYRGSWASQTYFGPDSSASQIQATPSRLHQLPERGRCGQGWPWERLPTHPPPLAPPPGSTGFNPESKPTAGPRAEDPRSRSPPPPPPQHSPLLHLLLV